MKKLGVIISLLVLFSLLPGVIGCAKTPTTPTTPTIPTTPTSPTTPTTPTVSGAKTFPPTPPPLVEKTFKPVKLKYGDYRAYAPGYFGQLHVMIPWAKAVEAVTNGRIVIEAYPGGSLVSIAQAEQQASQGVADLTYTDRRTAGINPMVDVMRLPPPLSEDGIHYLMIRWFVLYDYFKKDDEKLGLRSLAPMSLPQYPMITAKKPVRKFEDVKGLTLMSTDPIGIKMLTAMGAIVVPISSLDGYEALQKGIADGGVWDWNGPFQYGWIDAFKPGYFIDIGGWTGTVTENVLINQQADAKIPPDLRDTFEYVVWRWASVFVSNFTNRSVVAFQKEAGKRGIQLINWSDEDKAKLRKLKDKVVDDWIADMEKKYKRGAEAAEVAKAYYDAAKRYAPPALVPIQPQLGVNTQAEWDAVYGPGSNWGMTYKAYPNQIGVRKLEGNEFRPWK